MPNETARFVLDLSLSAKQKEFFLSETKFTAYGGARGGGKSYALRYKLLLMCLSYPGIRVLLIRRSYPELQENHIRPMRELLAAHPEVAVYHEKEKCFSFSCGSTMLFGYLSDRGDLLRYQGGNFDVVAFDEATQFDEYAFRVMSATVRGANDFPKRMYLTCNPGGVGHGWVKRLFIDRDFHMGERPCDYRFIPASVYDNEALMKANPDYVTQLESLPDALRAAWLDGKWDVFAGQFFSEFDEKKHVTSPFTFPKDTAFYCAVDYGLDMLAALFIAVTADGRAYVYDEIYESDLIVSRAAAKICEKLRADMTVIAPADLWGRGKDSGRSAAELFAEGGVYFTKLVPSRIDGWLSLKEWLADADGVPRLRFFPRCKNIIRCLPLLLYDEDRAGDAATEPHEITHAPDALRYFASFRQIGGVGEKTLYRGRGIQNRKEGII